VPKGVGVPVGKTLCVPVALILAFTPTNVSWIKVSRQFSTLQENLGFLALNSLICADVPLRNYSLTQPWPIGCLSPLVVEDNF